MEDSKSKEINPMCFFDKCTPSSKKKCHAICSLENQAECGAGSEGWDEKSWGRYKERVRKMYLEDSGCYHPKKLKKALKKIKPPKFKEENV